MPLSPELEQRKHDLKGSLNGAIHEARRSARINYGVSLTLMVIALGCTVAAGVSGMLLDRGRWAGGLAVLPPLIAYVAISLKLQGKAQWHRRMEGQLRALKSRLKYELSEFPTADQIAAISKSQREMEESMREDWKKHLGFEWA